MYNTQFKVKLFKGKNPEELIREGNSCIKSMLKDKFVLIKTELFSKNEEYICMILFHSIHAKLQFPQTVKPKLVLITKENFAHLEESLNKSFEAMKDKKYYPTEIQFLNFKDFSFLITYRYSNLQLEE